VETSGPWPYFREEKKRRCEGGNFSTAPESVRGLKAVTKESIIDWTSNEPHPHPLPPPEGEGNRYVPPPSRGRLGGGWESVRCVFSIMDSLVSTALFVTKKKNIRSLSMKNHF